MISRGSCVIGVLAPDRILSLAALRTWSPSGRFGSLTKHLAMSGARARLGGMLGALAERQNWRSVEHSRDVCRRAAIGLGAPASRSITVKGS